MGTLVFIAALAVVIIVAAWYAANEAAGDDGAAGILGLRAANGGNNAPDPPLQSYRARSRSKPGGRTASPAAEGAKSYRVVNDRRRAGANDAADEVDEP